MIFMKKGKTPQDRLLHMYKAHKGPVRAMRRNPMFIKNFITCGDYQVRLFAEDCRDSQILWSPIAVIQKLYILILPAILNPISSYIQSTSTFLIMILLIASQVLRL